MNDPQDSNSASVADARARAPDESAGSFIINLCALPGPALPEDLPLELAGLRAFVSRRTKDGIHRFYLHVGFFHSLDDANAWLGSAHAKYPGAFVSKLAETLRPSEPGTPPVADTQVVKELDKEHGTASAPRAVVWPMRAAVSPPPPQAKPAPKPDVPKAAKSPSAADAWSAFIDEVNNDPSSSSGVRHLRVEFQRPRKRPGKSPKPRK